MRRVRNVATGRLAAALAIVTVVLSSTLPDTARADSPTSFARDVAAMARTVRRRAEISWDYQAERELVNRLDGLADRFHRLADAGAPIASAARSLIESFERTRSRYTAVLERLQADVIARDGDLEAVQDSDAWRQRELLAMRLLYRLNWLRYDTAMRYERAPARRKELLKAALSGFAEFFGASDSILRVEALLGHGLTLKALKHYEPAIDDLRAGLAEHPDADMARRLRVALVETLVADHRIDEAIRESRLLVGDDLSPGPLAWFARAKALILGLERGRRDVAAEARSALSHLAAAGAQWRRKARQLIEAGLRDPSVLAGGDPVVTVLVADTLRRRGDCQTATPLYHNLLKAEPPAADALYGLGECEFEAGSVVEAGKHLSRFLETAPAGDPRIGRAAYLRFKAAELAYIQAGEPLEGSTAASYEATIRDFLDRVPDHPRAGEAWFRLGELYRRKGNHRKCHDAFARVAGDPGLSFEAHFLGAQCLVEAVSQSADPAAAVEALDAVVQEYEKAVKDHSAKALSSTLAAKAALMAASLAPSVPGSGIEARLDRLAEFQQRFTPPPDLAAQAGLLRLAAFRSLGRFREAAAEVESLVAGPAARAIDAETWKKLAVALVRDGSDLQAKGNAAAARFARRAAASIYRYLLTEADAGRLDLDTATRDSIIRLLGRLAN